MDLTGKMSRFLLGMEQCKSALKKPSTTQFAGMEQNVIKGIILSCQSNQIFLFSAAESEVNNYNS